MLVALGQRVATSDDRGGPAGVRRIAGAPARAFLGRGIQVDLHVGAGKHDRADVAALHDDAAAGAHLALTLDEHGAHARQPRHGGRGAIDLRRADRARDVVSSIVTRVAR